MHLLYPSSPLHPRLPDEQVAAEVAAVRAVGFEVSLFSLENFQGGEFRANPSIPSGVSVLYRGWMLSAQEYESLVNAIVRADASPVTSAEVYLASHHLPNWYPRISDLTPETRIFPPECDLEAELRALAWPEYFIKDYVKSLKTSVGSRISKAAVKSAGSGPAMRSAIIGAYYADDAVRRREYVLASSRLTHRGWQAETAALAVAECAALAASSGDLSNASQVVRVLRELSAEDEWQTVLVRIEAGLANEMSVAEFVNGMGLQAGVTGYSLHVVPVAIYAWLRHPGDFRTALIAALECGGDTDTVGTILGALAGASAGNAGIPADWLKGIWEWPRSVAFINRVAARLEEQMRGLRSVGPVRYFWPGLVFRNLLFIVIVLLHGFRRLAPPY